LTNPELVTVANKGLEDIHGLIIAGEGEPISKELDPTQSALTPETAELALTVIVAVIIHPLMFVYVIVDVPGEIAVMSPEVETDKIVGALDIQGEIFDAVPLPIS
jgi:hypothetical protein